MITNLTGRTSGDPDELAILLAAKPHGSFFWRKHPFQSFQPFNRCAPFKSLQSESRI